MRVVFAGTPETAIATLNALLASKHEVVAVVTRPDARVGRGRTLQASAVADVASEHGIEVLKPTRADDPDFMSRMRELAPDLGVVVAYGALLKRELLDLPEFGWINLHFSVLPLWRGAAPVQRALISGDDLTGASVFSLVEELDAGAVLGTITERIAPDDTTGTLLARLAEQGSALTVDVVNHLAAGDISPIAQNHELATYAAKLSSEEGQIDWHRPAVAIDRHIRGFTPDPGAWTQLGNLRIKVGPVSIANSSELAPGHARIDKKRVLVGTASNDVVLGEVQPHGKKLMRAADWGRGLGGTTEVVFG